MTLIARRSSALLLSALVCVAALLVVSPPAQSATLSKCTLSKSDKGANKYGPSYLKTLKVKNVTCGNGKTLVRAYNKCRTSGGKGTAGRCTKKVSGYSCTETRSNKSVVSFDAKVTCKNGTKQVVHTYQQLL